VVAKVTPREFNLTPHCKCGIVPTHGVDAE